MYMFSQEDLEDMMYVDYLDERGCLCDQNDDCCCLSQEDFLYKFYRERDEFLGEVV